jgi:hypothetical protein
MILDWFTKTTTEYKILAVFGDNCAYAKITTIKRPWSKEVHKERRFATRDVLYWRDSITKDYLPI